jgi:hypothetical protein
MSLDCQQFTDCVIISVLDDLDLLTNAAVELVLGTAIQESHLTYLKQIGGGPAVGVFQMEPATHDDIYDNFLKYHDDLKQLVSHLAIEGRAQEMMGNLYYAAAMCRVHYYRVSEALPDVGDIEAQAAYWKQYYNTPLGAGTVDEYIANWYKYTGA